MQIPNLPTSKEAVDARKAKSLISESEQNLKFLRDQDNQTACS